MTNTDPRIDSYIEKAAGFAKPILKHVRQVVHKACPEVVETIKWGFPHFGYHGGILCSMASFKQHCVFNFWLGSLLEDPHKVLIRAEDKSAMGQLGQLKNLDDLPKDVILIEYLQQAMNLANKGVKIAKKEKPADNAVEMPAEFSSALINNHTALSHFERFSPSQKREYVEWISEAKTSATRQKRIDTSIEWIGEGKIRNWKYLKKPATNKYE